MWKGYKHQPEPITEDKGATILWVYAIQTVGKIKNNWSDILVKHYKRKTWHKFDMSVPADNDLSVKEYDKIL